jgi:hypothetical protein
MTIALNDNYLSNDLIAQFVNNVLPTTEGGGDYFSYAAQGNSTYSFGAFQFDVGARADVRAFLQQIGFSQQQVSQLSQQGGLSQAQLATLNTQFTTALQNANNAVAYQALKNAEGTALTTGASGLQQALAAIAQTNPSIANQVYQSEELQLRLLDYANQYGGLQANGVMVSALKNLATNTQVTGDTIRNIVLTQTVQGQMAPQEVNSRQDRMNAAIADIVAGPGGLDMSAVDVSQQFAGTLNGTRVNVSQGASAEVFGSGNSLTIANGGSVVVSDGNVGGAGNEITYGDSTTIVNGVAVASALANGTLSLGGNDLSVVVASGQVSFSGTNGTIVVEGSASLTVSSDSTNDTITVNGDNSAVLNSGSHQQMIINGDNVVSINNGNFCSVVMNGNGDIEYWNCEGLVATVAGSGNVLATQDGSSGGQITVTGTDAVIDLDRVSVVLADGASAQVDGFANSIVLGNSTTLEIGSESWGDTVDVNGSHSIVVDAGLDNDIDLNGNYTSVTFDGGGSEDGTISQVAAADGSYIRTVTSTIGGQSIEATFIVHADGTETLASVNAIEGAAPIDAAAVRAALQETGITSEALARMVDGSADLDGYESAQLAALRGEVAPVLAAFDATDVDGIAQYTNPDGSPITPEQLSGAFGTLNSVSNLVRAIQSGNPLSIATAVTSLAGMNPAGFASALFGTEFVEVVSIGASGLQIAGNVNRLLDALNRGDVGTALTAGLSVAQNSVQIARTVVSFQLEAANQLSGNLANQVWNLGPGGASA